MTNTVLIALFRNSGEIIGVFRWDYVLEDARRLAASGVKELNIVAQETTTWGKDIYGEKRLHVLLRELCKVEGIRWIRLLYCYPEEITDELIEVLRTEPKICHYLDMPIQHSSDAIFKTYGTPDIPERTGGCYREASPGNPGYCPENNPYYRFSGETEEDHEDLKSFVQKMEFDRLGVLYLFAGGGNSCRKRCRTRCRRNLKRDGEMNSCACSSRYRQRRRRPWSEGR